MIIHKIVRTVSGTCALGLAFAAWVVAMPVSVHAADIAWHAASKLTEDNSPNWKREGTAVFTNGEKATLVSSGTTAIGVVDETGARPFKGQSVFRFDDGATITMQQTGTRNVVTGATTGSGEFIAGTGRYEGIAGKVTAISSKAMPGTVLEGDWVGSYTLPIKTILLRPAGWSGEWSRSGEVGISEFRFEARGGRIVARIRNVTNGVDCERDVTIISDVVTLDGCVDVGIALRFDPNDSDYPFKGESPREFKYKLKAM